MKVDVRYPIGALLLVYGGLLSLYGMYGAPEQYVRSLSININLIWGIVLFLVGGVLLGVAFLRRNYDSNEHTRED
jgi:hypothetical protein